MCGLTSRGPRRYRVPPVLGSRSYDVMSAIGPRPLQPGDSIPVGPHTEDYPELDQAPVAAITGDLVEPGWVPGPRDEWLTDADGLVHTDWVASDRSDGSASGWSGLHWRIGGRSASCPARVPPGAPSRYPEWAAGDPRPGSPGDRWLPRRRGHHESRCGQGGADPPGPEAAVALDPPTYRSGNPHGLVELTVCTRRFTPPG